MLIAGLGISVMFIVLFLVLVFGMGQVAWIYLDSKKREDRLGIVWTIFALIPIFYPMILPLPIIIYLLVTRNFSEKCPNCEERVSINFEGCPSCGYELKSKCNNCGNVIKKIWTYCPYCKENIKKGGI